MNRITDRNLEALVTQINALLNAPAQPYVDGKAQVGNYHLSYAYGGVALDRMHNADGGTVGIFACGHVARRDLYNRMRALLLGIEIKAAV